MKIEVFIPVYNHGKFIQKAIKSVLEQETTYNYQVVVSNDCSPDNSLEQIQEIASQNTDYVTVINHEKNVGMMNNYYQYLNATDADIILFCEGDDYWVDKNKLQRQVDFLLANEKCAVTFCATSNITFDTEEQVRIAKDVGGRGKYYLNDILPHNTLNTLSSVAIRNTMKGKYPEWYKSCNTPDGPLYFAILGDDYYIQYDNFIGTNYRVEGGSWSDLNKIDQQKSSIETYEVLLGGLPKQNTKACHLAILISLITLAKEYRKVDRKTSLEYCKKVVAYPYNGWKKIMYILVIPFIVIGLIK